jgi:hypothetical protein
MSLGCLSLRHPLSKPVFAYATISMLNPSSKLTFKFLAQIQLLICGFGCYVMREWFRYVSLSQHYTSSTECLISRLCSYIPAVFSIHTMKLNCIRFFSTKGNSVSSESAMTFERSTDFAYPKIAHLILSYLGVTVPRRISLQVLCAAGTIIIRGMLFLILLRPPTRRGDAFGNGMRSVVLTMMNLAETYHFAKVSQLHITLVHLLIFSISYGCSFSRTIMIQVVEC